MTLTLCRGIFERYVGKFYVDLRRVVDLADLAESRFSLLVPGTGPPQRMVDGFAGGVAGHQIGRPGSALLEPGIVALDGLAEPPVEMAPILNLARLRVNRHFC